MPHQTAGHCWPTLSVVIYDGRHCRLTAGISQKYGVMCGVGIPGMWADMSADNFGQQCLSRVVTSATWPDIVG